VSRKILVTGGAGFIGSNYLNYKAQFQDSILINLDKLTYAADIKNIEIKNSDNYTFIEGDICDKALVQHIFSEYEIDTVVHFAAESHVDNSINNPGEFIETNIVGTFNLLQIAYKNWMKGPNDLLSEYFHTYGLPVITTNCSNNYGPRQHKEKLIPTIIRKAINEEQIPIYGDGKNIRDWLYVLDHCKGIDLALRKGELGATYNIGGKNERQNIYIAETICAILDSKHPRENNKPYQELITFVKDRPGHDFRYAIDASKIENELGWKAEENFETGIEKTIDWYLEKYKVRS